MIFNVKIIYTQCYSKHVFITIKTDLQQKQKKSNYNVSKELTQTSNYRS